MWTGKLSTKWSTMLIVPRDNAAHPAGLLHQEVHHQSQENHHKRHSPPGNKPPMAAIWLTTPFLHGQNGETDEELTKSSQAIRKIQKNLPHTWCSPQTYAIHSHTTNPYLSTFKFISHICVSCVLTSGPSKEGTVQTLLIQICINSAMTKEATLSLEPWVK